MLLHHFSRPGQGAPCPVHGVDAGRGKVDDGGAEPGLVRLGADPGKKSTEGDLA